MDPVLHIHNGTYPKPEGHLRFVCVSDTHSREFFVPDGDVLVHAGDFTKKGTELEVMEFARVLRGMPHKYKVVVAGNHDTPFDVKNYERILSRQRNPNPCNPFAVKLLLNQFFYLEDSFVEIGGYKIWGTPWSQQHYIGAFNSKDKEFLRDKFMQIPNGMDIIVSHSPPYGILDITRDNKSVGSLSLAQVVERIKPKVHIFGHIHESHGYTCVDGITYINASVCNNRYQAIYQPIVFDLPIIKNEN